MARGDSLYVRIDSELLDSHEWKSATPAARCLYLYLWNYAVKNRHETFPLPKQHILSGGAGIPQSKVKLSLDELKIIPCMRDKKTKIIELKDRLITITDSQAKHAKLKGWHDPYGENMGNLRGDCGENRGKQGEGEGEKKREDSELVNSEQAPQLDIEALGRQMGVQSVTANLEEQESFGNFAATLQTHFGKQSKEWVAAAKSWAGKTWNYQLRPKDKPKDRDSENFREWNNKRLKLRHRLLRVIMEIQTEGRPFQYDTANAKLHNPNNSELQARSDAHKRELEV